MNGASTERQVVTQRDVDEASYMNLESAQGLVRKTESLIEHLAGASKVTPVTENIEVRGTLPRIKAEQDSLAVCLKHIHSNLDQIAHLLNHTDGPPLIHDLPDAAIRRGPSGRR